MFGIGAWRIQRYGGLAFFQVLHAGIMCVILVALAVVALYCDSVMLHNFLVSFLRVRCTMSQLSESRYTVSWCCVFLHASLTYSNHNMQISYLTKVQTAVQVPGPLMQPSTYVKLKTQITYNKEYRIRSTVNACTYFKLSSGSVLKIPECLSEKFRIELF